MPDPAFLRLGLIGWPVEHSLSPILHQTAMAALRMEGEYHLYPVNPLPAGEEKLLDLLREVRSSGLHGLNVTIPHKQTVLPYLDELTPTAAEVGAVNTIIRTGTRLIGENTDISGFVTDLQRFLSEGSSRGSGKPCRALVLGAGGAARSVVYGLAREGWHVTVAARRVDRANELASSLCRALQEPTQIEAIPLNTASIRTSLVRCKPDLIVNTTPVGMVPDIQATPWPEEVAFPTEAVLYDLIYTPCETSLVRTARSAGLRATGGAGMLIEQAAQAFERWTGQAAPRLQMLHAFDQALPVQEIS